MDIDEEKPHFYDAIKNYKKNRKFKLIEMKEVKNRILITGGAGFIGSNLGYFLSKDMKWYAWIILQDISTI
jgi:hypothetical protein